VYSTGYACSLVYYRIIIMISYIYFLLTVVLKRSPFQMGMYTLVNSRVSFVMASESTYGQTDQYTRAIGLMEIGQEKGF